MDATKLTDAIVQRLAASTCLYCFKGETRVLNADNWFHHLYADGEYLDRCKATPIWHNAQWVEREITQHMEGRA